MHLQDQKTERWNVQGVVKDGRISEEGTILSYNIILSNIHITNRHRRFIQKQILSENPVELNTQNGDTDIPDAAGLDRLEGTAGVQTRAMRKNLGKHSVDKGIGKLQAECRTSHLYKQSELRKIFTCIQEAKIIFRILIKLLLLIVSWKYF